MNKRKGNNEKRNKSGCLDLTAYTAIKNIDDEEARFKHLLHTLFYICDLADFNICERVVLEDKKTGRIWR